MPRHPFFCLIKNARQTLAHDVLATHEKKKDAFDKLIAAHAVALGVVIVTYNMKDFARYPNVTIENWLTPSTP